MKLTHPMLLNAKPRARPYKLRDATPCIGCFGGSDCVPDHSALWTTGAPKR